MNYAYVRVSTKQQNEERQIETLKKYEIDKWYIEKASGATMDRPKMMEMLRSLKKGDAVYISDFSRLARNTYDLLCIAEDLEHNGVNLVSDKEKLDMSTASGKLIITVIAAVNEFERNITLERQKEGIAIAKEKGVYKGSKPKQVDEKLFADNLVRYRNGEITKTEFASVIGVSRPTLNKILNLYRED